MPKVSVIIPIYNVERYLRQCLDSVINQTLKDIEIICVNDGSTDGSLEILEEYAQKDDRIKIINKENGGQSSARNIGIKHASANYIGFVDSDDYIDKSMYEKAYNLMESENVDLVVWGANIVKDKDLKMKSKQFKSIVGYHTFKFGGKQELRNNKVDIYSQIAVTVWNKLFKRSVITENEIEFPEGILFEDNDFFTKYFLCSNNIYFLNDKLYYYLQRKNSTMFNTVYSQNDCKRLLDYIVVYKSLWSFCNEHSLLVSNVDLMNFIFDRFLKFMSNYYDLEQLNAQLSALVNIIDNDVLNNPNVEFIENNEFYKIPHLGIKIKSFGNSLFGCDIYINKKIFKIFGIKYTVKKQ